MQNNLDYIFKFTDAITQGRDFEIRLLPETGSNNLPIISIMKHGDYLYSAPGKKLCEYNIKNFIQKVDLKQYGFHFTVNSPDFNNMKKCSTSDKDIVYINAQSIDIDFNEDIKRLKKEKKTELLNFKLKPNIIVETKRGLHAYWFLVGGEHKYYKLLQLQLAKYFKGEESPIFYSKCMRLPGFTHKKDPAKPFAVYPEFIHSGRYSQKELRKALPPLAEEDFRKLSKQDNEENKIEYNPKTKEEVIKYVERKLDVVKEYEHKITTHCIFPELHNYGTDRNPSAWFDKEYLWYHCSSCNTHLSIKELAEELGWEKLIKLFKKEYTRSLNLPAVIKAIAKYNRFDIPDENLDMTTIEKNLHSIICNNVFQRFIERKQNINSLHSECIENIVNILITGKPSNVPTLITLAPGGGKSLIIEEFVLSMLQKSLIEHSEQFTSYLPAFGAVVVKEYKKDVKEFCRYINKNIGKKVAHSLYGFENDECKARKEKCNKVIQKNCLFKKECRYYKQYIEAKKFPIIVITHKRLWQDNEKGQLSANFRYWKDENKIEHSRKYLLIDEKPILHSMSKITEKEFEKYINNIIEKLDKFNGGGRISKSVQEFINLVKIVKPLFNYKGNRKERYTLESPDFLFVGSPLTREFWIDFYQEFDWNSNEFEIPSILEDIIEYEGHRGRNQFGQVYLNTSHYNKYTFSEDFFTVIFDGTGDIDTAYKHDFYRCYFPPPIKQYNNLTFYYCDYLKSTKGYLQIDGVLTAQCEQVKDLLRENPKSKLYFCVYKEYKNFVKNYPSLEKYIKSKRLKLGHFGGTRGSNEYLDCDICYLGGVLHKTEDYYIALQKSQAQRDKTEVADNLAVNIYDGVRRFKDERIEAIKLLDMHVDVVQEAMRCIIRNMAENLTAKIYIVSDDKIFLESLQHKFPGSKVEQWNPMHMVRNKVKNRKHKQAKNERIVYEFFENIDRDIIYFEEIIKDTGITKSHIVPLFKKDTIKAIIAEKNYFQMKDPVDKRKVIFKKLQQAEK